MKTKSIPSFILFGVALLAFAGCDSGSRKQASAVAKLTAPPEPAASKHNVEDAVKLRSGSRAVDKAAPDGGDKFDDNTAVPLPLDDKNPGSDPSAGRVKAEPGVGAKDFGGGPLGQPFEVYFGIKEKIIFGQVKHAMDLYKGLNGSFPKSHDEFMAKVIKDNGIKLPELPEGNVYEYDPKSADLYVAPAKDPSAVADEAKFKSQVLQLVVAIIREDAGTLADRTHPKVIEVKGGRDKAVAAIESSIKEIKSNGFVIQFNRIEEPARTVKAGAQWFVGVPFQLGMKMPGGSLVVRRMFVGISDDERKTWYWMDVGADSSAMQEAFPNIPEQFKSLPETKPKFEPD